MVELVHEGQRIGLAWELWQLLAEAHCNSEHLTQARQTVGYYRSSAGFGSLILAVARSPYDAAELSELSPPDLDRTVRERRAPARKSVISLVQPPLPPPEIVGGPPDNQQPGPPTFDEQQDQAWGVGYGRTDVGAFIFEVDHWKQAQTAFRLLKIEVPVDPAQARSPATLDKLAEHLENQLLPYGPVHLPRGFSNQPSLANVQKLVEAETPVQWKQANRIFSENVRAFEDQFIATETMERVFYVAWLMFMVLIPTLSIPAVGVGTFWAGLVGWAGLPILMTSNSTLDFFYSWGNSIVLCLNILVGVLLILVMLHAVFGVIPKRPWIKFIAILVVCFSLSLLYLWSGGHGGLSRMPHHKLIDFSILLLANVLSRLLFSRMRTLPDSA